MGYKTRGLYNKFEVRRTDGHSAPGEKHEGCEYFVLDLTHDPHALPAIAAYSNSCALDYPKLAKGLHRVFLKWEKKQRRAAEAIHLKGGGI